MRGADALASETGTAIAGGDVVSAPVLFVSVAVTGWLQEGEQPLTRDGAKPGDLVGVTGELGAAAALLAVLDGRAPGVLEAEGTLERARRPMPRLAEGRALGAAGANAMIDLSDGLAADAAALGRASGVSLALEAELLPLARGVAAVAERLGSRPRRSARPAAKTTSCASARRPSGAMPSRRRWPAARASPGSARRAPACRGRGS